MKITKSKIMKISKQFNGKKMQTFYISLKIYFYKNIANFFCLLS